MAKNSKREMEEREMETAKVQLTEEEIHYYDSRDRLGIKYTELRNERARLARVRNQLFRDKRTNMSDEDRMDYEYRWDIYHEDFALMQKQEEFLAEWSRRLTKTRARLAGNRNDSYRSTSPYRKENRPAQQGNRKA